MKNYLLIIRKVQNIGLLLFLLVSTVNAQGNLYGVTSGGGNDDLGALFNTNLSGVFQSVLYSWQYDKTGSNPAGGLVLANNGKYYGIAAAGGANKYGVLFEYDVATNSYTSRVDFDGAAKGGVPYSSLMKATNGKLYGVTRRGGSNNKGVVYEYDPALDIFTKRADFDSVNTGCLPSASMVEAANGMFYGVTILGGLNNSGVLYEFNPANYTLTKKIDFNGTTMGGTPNGALAKATNGKLYGLTISGGSNGNGVLFEYNTTNNAIATKVDFDASTKGSSPAGVLTEATNGKFYGTTYDGGANNKGTLFEYNPTTNAFAKKLDFTGTNGTNPFGKMLQASNGNLYGTTIAGGTGNNGVLFEYKISTNVLTVKVEYTVATNGAVPSGYFIEASNGKLYGLTLGGGSSNNGTLYEYTPSATTFTKKRDFSPAVAGSTPAGGLIIASNGNLYGMTVNGGNNGFGVLYEYNRTTNKFTKKVDFTGTTNGSYPYGSLTEASNGKLYGMTSAGGANGKGVLFEFDPSTGNLVKKVDFSTANGASPYGTLCLASNGKLYGLTSSGGSSNKGTLFEYDITTSLYTKKLDFTGSSIGSSPYGGLKQVTSGKIYGLTSLGGATNNGVLFEYNITTNSILVRVHFDGTNKGANPYGTLVNATNGKLYGVTKNGGLGGFGVLFEYDVASTAYSNKHDFALNDGANPDGSLTAVQSGKLYGLTKNGGSFDVGVAFEYNPANSAFTEKFDFDNSIGAQPQYAQLVSSVPLIGISELSSSNSADNVNIYPNPFSSQFTIDYNLEKRELVSIQLIDITGKTVASITNKEPQQEGKHTMTVNTEKLGLVNGFYILKLQVGDQVIAKKLNALRN